MSSYPNNPFIDDYLPNMFWPAQLQTFGRQVNYLPQGDAAQAVAVDVLWKEGASDEDVSPGRYSHMDVRNADLPAAPELGDTVAQGGKTYSVVRVDALAVGFSVIVLQEVGATP